jgi:hypothetical protein
MIVHVIVVPVAIERHHQHCLLYRTGSFLSSNFASFGLEDIQIVIILR